MWITWYAAGSRCVIWSHFGWCAVLSHAWLFVTPWTVARQVPLPTELFPQEYWVGYPFLLPDPGTELMSLVSPALAGGFFTISATWESPKWWYFQIIFSIRSSGREFSRRWKFHGWEGIHIPNCIPEMYRLVASNAILKIISVHQKRIFVQWASFYVCL